MNHEVSPLVKWILIVGLGLGGCEVSRAAPSLTPEASASVQQQQNVAKVYLATNGACNQYKPAQILSLALSTGESSLVYLMPSIKLTDPALSQIRRDAIKGYFRSQSIDISHGGLDESCAYVSDLQLSHSRQYLSWIEWQIWQGPASTAGASPEAYWTRLHILDLTNTNSHQIREIDDLWEGSLSWSPNDQSIVYSYGRPTSIVGFTNLVTGTKFNIGQGFQPVWSPNSKEVAFLTSPTKEGNKIVIASIAQATDIRQVSLGGDSPPIISWAPVGNLSFIPTGRDNNVYQLNSVTMETKLFIRPDRPSFFRYSPDGKLVALYTPNSFVIYDEVGNLKYDLSKTFVFYSSWAWSPNNSQIVVVYGDTNYTQRLGLVDVTTNKVTNLPRPKEAGNGETSVYISGISW